MDYDEACHAMVSVNRAIAELLRHDCVKRAYATPATANIAPCLTAEGIDGEVLCLKINAQGMVRAKRIFDWLGY